MTYTEDEARRLVIEAGHRLLETGLIARTWGNISARISDTEFVITPSGRAYDDLRPEELVKVRIADCGYEGEIKPSSEKGIHADCYRLRPEVGFVIHTHQFYATAVGADGRDLKEPFVPNAAYGMPSTGRLRRNVASVIERYPDSDALFMTRHGALCLGTTFERAFEIADKLEKDCEAVYRSRVKEEDEIIAVSRRGRTFRPGIDDLVQIAGTSIRCVSSEAGEPERLKALKGRNALLICGKGAVCTGDDREAVEMILRKGCAAALYTGDFSGMNPFDAFLQRFIYVRKYSKRKQG